MEPRLFEFDWLRAKSHLRGSSQGRGNAHYLHFAGRDFVLRPFHRGGLIGKFNRDRYFYARVGDSRAMREFMLLDWMRTQGLPVPWPVAARHRASGLFYRADLITERIPNARPLAEVLLERAIQEHSWSRIGTVIRQMHSLGVYHADLNCRNVLLDASERVWLIDFDKCKRRVPGGWMQRNLARLKRSLVKTRRENSDLNWAEQKLGRVSIWLRPFIQFADEEKLLKQDQTGKFEERTLKRTLMCMKWGKAYAPDYVNVLASAVRKNLSGEYRFVCFTDDTSGISSDIETLPIPEMGTIPRQLSLRCLAKNFAIQARTL